MASETQPAVLKSRFNSTRLWEILLYLPNLVMESIEKRIGSHRMPFVFLLPYVTIAIIFFIIPALLNFAYSTTGGDQILLENRPSVGLANFERLAVCDNYADYQSCSEDYFWRALSNTLLFVIIEVPVMNVCALAVATALNRRIKGRWFFRSAFFYPVLLSPVVVALIWKWILRDRNGLLNTLLMFMGQPAINFTTNSEWMFFWAIFVSIWSQVGFYALILLAGMQSIPAVLYEASTIDGANEWASFRKITIPLLMPTLLVVIILTVIRAVQAFDHVYVLTGGGPGTATTFIVQYIYRTGFEFTQFGLAAAASLVMAVILAVLTVSRLLIDRRSRDGEM